MTALMTTPELRARLDAALAGDAELAVLDVREAGQYAAGHLFFATHVPYSRLEIEIGGFVPRKTVPIVIYDADNGVSEKAATALGAMGYTDVAVLEGGAPAWAAAGHTLYEGVNLPSKTFGELVEHVLDTPRLSADDLADMQEKGGDFIILDGRTPEEYARFNIPGGISCPNAELPLRFDDLVPNRETTVVINCAGRTRSIIGAQTLINFGVVNKVIALENGTQGWSLTDRALETDAKRFPPSSVMAPALARARERSARVADAYDLSFIDLAQLAAWQADTARTLFLFDVRSADEFRAARLPNSRSAPGGQLVQATDRWVGVRGARIVVYDDTEVRAVSTAHWLKQMGWEVHVLRGGIANGDLESGPPQSPQASNLAQMTAEEVQSEMANGTAIVVDMRSSQAFHGGHIPGAVWAIRPTLDQVAVDAGARVVLVTDDPAAAALVAGDLQARGVTSVSHLQGGMASWTDADGDVAASGDGPENSDRIDFAAFTAQRHGGNKDHMRQYLAWEIGLVDQLDDQERGVFNVVGV